MIKQVIGTSALNQMLTPTQGFSVREKPGVAKRGLTNNKLNLVSLMDIFTILVFFLMLNSGDVEVLQPDPALQLPVSSATLKPNVVSVIKITPEAIFFKDQHIVQRDSLEAGKGLPALEQALNAYRVEQENGNKHRQIIETNEPIRGVSIMSDAAVDYALLKRVLYASAQAGYRDIGLATELGASNVGKLK